MKVRLGLMLRGVNVGSVRLPVAAFCEMLAGLGLEGGGAISSRAMRCFLGSFS